MSCVTRTILVGALVVGALASQPTTVAVAQGGFTLHGKTRGHCTLVNVTYGRELYNGSCTIAQTIDGTTNRFAIKLGAAEPFLFATTDGRTWMHGPDPVQFRDRGHTGLFRWGDFRLEVDEFH